MSDNDLIDYYAEMLFKYENISKEPGNANAIIAFGSHDKHVAHYAAKLYMEGYAPYILFSGGYGRITREIWNKPEALVFSELAIQDGVPESAIIVDCFSTNTGENISRSKEMLEAACISSDSLIVVDRPYRCLRTMLALEAQWPEALFTMSAPPMDYCDYCRWYNSDGPITKETFISLLVGDLQRNIVYAENGLQSSVEIPQKVLFAYRSLIDLGFTDQMLNQ